MDSRHHARRASFSRLDETCPAVRAAIEEAITSELTGPLGEDHPGLDVLISRCTTVAMEEALKHGTDPLRSALIEAEEELAAEKAKVSELEDDISSLRDDLRDAKHDIHSLEQELSTLRD